MRHLAVAILSSVAAVLLWAALIPTTSNLPPPPPAEEPLTWYSPQRTVQRAAPSSVPQAARASLPSLSKADTAPYTPQPAGRVTIHVEDVDGTPIDDLWLSWVCQGSDGRGPEIRMPVEGGEDIDGIGDCYFQAVDGDGNAYSNDFPVALGSGEHLDVWLVVDSAS